MIKRLSECLFLLLRQSLCCTCHLLQIGHTIAKWVFILVINVTLVLFLIRYRARATHLQSTRNQGSGPGAKAKESNNSANRVLIGAVTLYTVCMFPQIVYICLKVASAPPYCSYNFPDSQQRAVRPFTQIIWMTNYAVTFLLYCAVSKKFRDEFLSWICRDVKAKAKKGKLGNDSSTELVTMEMPR